MLTGVGPRAASHRTTNGSSLRSSGPWPAAAGRAAGSCQDKPSQDFRGLRHLADRLGDDLLAGTVLDTGHQTLPFGPRFRAMPVAAIWEASPGKSA